MKIKVADVNEVSEGGLKKVDVNGEAVALFKIGGKIFATSNICTHAQCELDHNHAMHGEVVECACHGKPGLRDRAEAASHGREAGAARA